MDTQERLSPLDSLEGLLRPEAPSEQNGEGLIRVLREIRNGCASSPHLQRQAAIERRIHLSLCSYLRSISLDDNQLLLRVAIQTIGNMGTTNEPCQEAIWADLLTSSDNYEFLLGACDDKALSDLVLVLHTMMCNSPERRADLVLRRGGVLRLLFRKLTQALNNTSSHVFENTFLLFQNLTEAGLFPSLVSDLRGSEEPFSLELKEALKLMDSQLHTTSAAQLRPAWLNAELISCLVALFRELDFATIYSRAMSAPESEQETESLAVLLNIFSDMAKASSERLTHMLIQERLISHAVDLLSALRAIKPVTLKHSTAPRAATSAAKGEGEGGREPQAPLEGFNGLKLGLIKVLGNLSFRNREAQDEVRRCEGIPAVLDCCNLDDANPYLKEWAVVAIRNLCENNLENQGVIQALRVQGPASTPILNEMGLEMELSEDGKNVRLKQKNPE